MRRLIAAEWIRVGRYWLTWALLVLLVAILVLQVRGRLAELTEMETEVATGFSAADGSQLSPLQIEGNHFLAEQLRGELCYPAFIGTAARLATDYGWFLVVVFAAVVGGEDFGRQTLRAILARGVRRIDYLLARVLVLWMATGVAVVAVAVLAASAGLYVHGRVSSDPVSLVGLGDALLCVLRSWITYLPFVAFILFWAVLGRNAGPALGVGLSLRFLGFLNGFAIPLVAAVIAGADAAGAAGVPLIFRWEVTLFGATLGHNASVFLHWGAPFVRDPFLLVEEMGIGSESLLSATPWRAVAFLAGYTIVSLGVSAWILCRRDVTAEV